ncbi:maleylpyruvate isomerase family mycothiol-dependent enzyme [Actinokineospora sp. UTMC 2448]|uniref:maleylpyruvate isomerase family mycothiol-dependent enzyme n=1 Tax=Actinokineospora sp. UTMC 2448 TaxID=2268449 RepID=UPI00216435BB|nr:maleylpyruvate isomerase family mycothiol-dependent enzyme [Actinokineospora sp. UTMC 2448]UVS77555.1 putative Actinobacterial protein [Actinokineospora sp. UTMC 2448]
MIPDWTRAERLSLADFLDALTDAEWRAPSLCPGWTVHDVAAHMTLSTRTGWRECIVGAIRARGDFNRMVARAATERAARFDRVELVAQLRETAGSPRRAPGSGLLDPLVDALVHGQDVARALGRVREMPEEQTVAALEHVLASRFYGARKRFRTIRLVATDADWTSGTGEARHAPLGDLLLAATGRTVTFTPAG